MNWTEYSTLIVIVILLHVGVFLYLRKKPRKSILGKHVLVTGGSSGIGLWVAINAAKLGAHVTLVARNISILGERESSALYSYILTRFSFTEKAQRIVIAHRLHESQKINIKAIDLSSDYDNISSLLSETEVISGDIYMLVNCAGLAICGTVEDTSAKDARFLMDVNYFGTFYPTKYVLPKMKRNGNGIIVITASQAAMLGIYGYGAYGASKFALRGLAECVAMETRHRGITVTLALPADTDTPGLKTENLTKPLITQIISGSGGLAKPEHVAKQLLDDALVRERVFF